MLPKEYGISPISLFAPKFRMFKLESFPIEFGILPVNKFYSKSSSVRLTIFDMCVGMLPPIKFPPSDNDVNRIERFVMELVNSPPSWL